MNPSKLPTITTGLGPNASATDGPADPKKKKGHHYMSLYFEKKKRQAAEVGVGVAYENPKWVSGRSEVLTDPLPTRRYFLILGRRSTGALSAIVLTPQKPQFPEPLCYLPMHVSDLSDRALALTESTADIIRQLNGAMTMSFVLDEGLNDDGRFIGYWSAGYTGSFRPKSQEIHELPYLPAEVPLGELARDAERLSHEDLQVLKWAIEAFLKNPAYEGDEEVLAAARALGLIEPLAPDPAPEVAVSPKKKPTAKKVAAKKPATKKLPVIRKSEAKV